MIPLLTTLFTKQPHQNHSEATIHVSVGPGFQAVVDGAGSASKTSGFKYDARVFVVGRWRWWLQSIGLRLETIIREADVRHTVDLPQRN